PSDTPCHWAPSCSRTSTPIFSVTRRTVICGAQVTTTVFSQRSMRWFRASLRRATPKGQDPSSSAQHRIKDPSYIGPSLRSGHTLEPHRLGLYRLVQMPGSHEVIFTNPNRLADKLVEAGRD